MTEQLARIQNEVSATASELQAALSDFIAASFRGWGQQEAGERYLRAAQQHLDATAAHVAIIRAGA